MSAFVLGAVCWLLTVTVSAVQAEPDHGPTILRRDLASGAKLYVAERHSLPIVDVRVLLDAGARRDPNGLPGLAYLTADLLTEGTTSRTAEQIDEAIDFLGASLGSGAGVDSAEVSLRVLRKDLDTGLALLADVLLHPRFDPAELERRREATLASIRARQDDPTQVASEEFQKAVFAGEPYGQPVDGTAQSLPRIGRAEIRRFFAQHYGPASARVVVVGDVTADEVHAALDRVLSGWQGGTADPFDYGPHRTAGPASIRIDKPVTQAGIVLGHRGVARNNPDYEALTVMNYILGGGGFSSRLVDNIRTQGGLAYSVSSYFIGRSAPGSFRIVMQTKNESVVDAIGRARSEVERIREEAVTEEEIQEAKDFLTGSFPLRIDTNADVAGFVAEIALYDLGLDYADQYMARIRSVSRADVQRVAREYLHPDRFVEVVVADVDRIGASTQARPEGE